MIRKTIYLEPHQDAAIQTLARASGLSETTLVRHAIHSYLHSLRREHLDLAVWDTEYAYLQRLTQQSATPPRTWRRDELYDE